MTTSLPQSQNWHKWAEPKARLFWLSRWFHPEEGVSPTELARAGGPSRQSLYVWRGNLLDALTPRRPGPDPAELERRRLREQVQALGERCRQLQAELDLARARNDACVPVTWARVWSVILVCAVCPVSHRDIQRIIAAAFGKAWVPSLGRLSTRLEHFGQVAARLLAGARAELGKRIRCLLADEVFLPNPVLAAVEVDSAACLAIEPVAERDGETWACLFAEFPGLKRVIADDGTGLQRGAALAGCQHGADNFHELKHWRDGLLRGLENSATAAFLAEDAAEGAFIEAAGARAENTAWAEVLLARRRAARALDDLEHGLIAYEELHKVYQPLTADGRLKTRAQARGHVDAAIQRLRSIQHRAGVAELINHLNRYKDHFTVYLEAFDDIPVHLTPRSRLTQREALCLAASLLHWERRLRSPERWPSCDAWRAARRRHARELRRFRAVCVNGFAVLTALRRKLRFLERSSSLIEALNSRIRAVQQVIKRPSAARLSLVALDYNLRDRAPWNRRGTDSPFRRLGISFAMDRRPFEHVVLAEAGWPPLAV